MHEQHAWASPQAADHNKIACGPVPSCPRQCAGRPSTAHLLQIKQGAHGSKFQQEDWRAGRKGGASADVGITASPDARETAFTDVRVSEGAAAARNGLSAAARVATGAPKDPPAASGVPHPHVGCPAANGVKTNGASAAAGVAAGGNTGAKNGERGVKGNGTAAAEGVATGDAKENAEENGNGWSKEQELALIKALKAISKDAEDRFARMHCLHALPPMPRPLGPSVCRRVVPRTPCMHGAHA